MQKITPYDVIERFYPDLCDMAARNGSDWNDVLKQINFDGREIKRGIEISKEYRGNVMVVCHQWTAPNGDTFPTIIFKTFKHGEIIEKFNGFDEWRNAEKYSNYTPQYDAAAEQKRLENAAKSAQIAADDDALKIEKHNQWLATFNELPKESGDFAYLVKKMGFHAALVAEFSELSEIKCGKDKHGNFILIAFKNSQNEIVGFQKIGDNTEGNNKFNIGFLPNSKQGSYHVIGNLKKGHKGLFFAEGYVTALSIYLATGQPVVCCIDAGNLESVVLDFANSGEFSNLIIAADNDCGNNENGNVGVHAALKIAHSLANKKIKIRVFVPQNDGKKCDFNDVLVEKGLPALKAQLAIRKNPNEIKPATNPLEYRLQLLEVAPKNQLKKVCAAACYSMAAEIPRRWLSPDGIQVVQQAIDARGFDYKADKLIKRVLREKIAVVEKRHTIINDGSITEIDTTGMDDAQIAALRISLGGVWFDDGQLGSGKTEKIAIEVKQLPHYMPVAVLTNRIGLTIDLARRLELAHYDDVSPNESIIQNLVCCIPSMPKFSIAKRFTGGYVAFDEYRQCREDILLGKMDNRLGVDNERKEIIRNAHTVILADADLNNDDVNSVKEITDKPLYKFKSNITKNGKTIVKLPSLDTLRVHALKTIQGGANVFIGNDTVLDTEKNNLYLGNNGIDADELERLQKTNDAEAEKTHKHLIKHGINADDLLMITAKNKNEPKQRAFLDNPNVESLKYRGVIYSPVGSSGLSVTNEHFTVNYGFFSGKTIAPNEALQTLMRNRCADTIYVAFAPQRANDKVSDFDVLMDGEVRKHGRWDKETQSPVLDDLSYKRVELIAKRHADFNDWENNVLILAGLKGFELRHEQCEAVAEIKGLSSAIKAANVAAILESKTISKECAKFYNRKNNTSLAEFNALERHGVEDLAGTPEINEENAMDYLNGVQIKVHNAELIDTPDTRLIDLDKANNETRDHYTSLMSKKWLITQVLDMVQSYDKGELTHKQAAEVCQWLNQNAAEIAANGLGNYTKISAYPIRTLDSFLKRYGHDLKELRRDGTGERLRIYAVVKNPVVYGYVEARAAARIASNVEPNDDYDNDDTPPVQTTTTSNF
jgi:phage/plasmid primase-like uncharacterized protein